MLQRSFRFRSPLDVVLQDTVYHRRIRSRLTLKRRVRTDACGTSGAVPTLDGQ